MECLGGWGLLRWELGGLTSRRWTLPKESRNMPASERRSFLPLARGKCAGSRASRRYTAHTESPLGRNVESMCWARVLRLAIKTRS